MTMRFEVHCEQIPDRTWERESAVEAQTLADGFGAICPGPHSVDAVFEDLSPAAVAKRMTERTGVWADPDWQDEADDADERARDRAVDEAMDFAVEDEMARHYGGA